MYYTVDLIFYEFLSKLLTPSKSLTFLDAEKVIFEYNHNQIYFQLTIH